MSVHLWFLTFVSDEYDHVGADSPAFADSIDAFAGLGFDRDCRHVDIEEVRDILSHLIDIGAKLWSLQIDDRVEIHHAEAFFTNKPNRVGEELIARSVPPTLVIVGKVRSKIPKGERSKDRVGCRMHKNIGVRMTVGSEVGLDLDAADNEWSSGNQPMNVSSKSDAIHK